MADGLLLRPEAEARREDWEAGGFALYVHWPFCQAKCPYCDFNSHVARSIDQTRWARAYEAEIARAAREVPGRVLRSIFLGGGTPSLMEPETVEAVIGAARAAWGFANDIEITMEANPTSVETERFRGYRAAGVNRLSLGVQALNDADLRRLGRLHSTEEAVAAFGIARETFERVSLDLIYARQGQTPEAWEAELAEALRLVDGTGAGHLSLYQLTIEEGTAFGDRFAAGKLRDLPDEDRAADLWDVTQRLTDAAGLPAYEVSNHAAEGQESRHNLVYWQGGDWVGVGPGAHGRLTLGGVRTGVETERAPGRWLQRVEEDGSGESGREALSEVEAAEERLMMGLRLREGVEMGRLGALDGLGIPAEELAGMGLVAVEDGRLRTTAAGRPVLNAVLRELLA
ncbi:Radical SAM family enzyme, similar to coproporphyrinogen III oxidase, oxygen-independent [Rubellimicrobium mesophilum DSM 19309]|uniref:Heme chaperone HemW n=1 Tax=Rubellimicrobium mesophilum DSM 19309 TaxID=442562 RepID=A0A017HJ30_9RHOB|nr:radical SAM family heme chaperone HemW [Rubellimicrobium mesophilum]EYD74148.1 Radical SAM family enzyme, similar to coproporphyrinogen III oxidase, oxygen-independent [Rubellimicrobium mesophilum DSM 19309]